MGILFVGGPLHGQKEIVRARLSQSNLNKESDHLIPLNRYIKAEYISNKIGVGYVSGEMPERVVDVEEHVYESFSIGCNEGFRGYVYRHKKYSAADVIKYLVYGETRII